MKKFGFLIFVLTLGFSLSLYAQPKLEYVGLNNNTFDWGNVRPNQSPLKTKIKIKNVGNKTLDIQRVKPGCSCTTSPVQKNKLNPGESTVIDVNLKLGAYVGAITKSITVTTNDPQHPDTYIYLKANVIRDIEYFPNNYFTFSNAMVGKASFAKVVLKNRTNREIKLKSYTSDNKDLSLKFDKSMKIPAKGELTLEAVLTAEKSGRIASRIVVKTYDKENPEIILDVMGNVK